MQSKLSYRLSLIIMILTLIVNASCCNRSGTIPNHDDNSPGETGLQTQQLKKIRIEGVELKVEIVDTPETRSKGLMFRTFLPQNQGMLFIFEQAHILNFWMKNTQIPLSIGFFDKNGVLFEIKQMKPYTIHPPTFSSRPGLYALEVNQGWFQKHNIQPGSRLQFLAD